jgi:hypothetical protein
MLKKTHVERVFEYKRDTPEGGLRLLFAWGKGGLWCLGAFVKTDDRQGNRILRGYEQHAAAAAAEAVPP